MKNIVKLLFAALLFITACSRTAEPVFQPGSIFAPSTPNITQPQQESSGINQPVGNPEKLQQSGGFFGAPSVSEPVKIAILLPLSGRFSEVGKNMLDAAQMSLFGINNSNITLIPIDTKETESDAVDAANQAVQQGAKLILGPVFSRAAQAIIPIAKQNNINVVAFSNDKNLAGSGIFTLGFIPEQQIVRALSYASSQGITDFTTIVPNNIYGGATAKRMREHAEKKSGSAVIKSEIFQVDKATGQPVELEKHFSAVYKAALNSRSPADYNPKTKKYNSNPIKYPRAMLLPDGGETLIQVAALLQKNNVDKGKVQLLGTSQWYSTDILKNPVFDGAWIAGPTRERREQFEEKFMSLYNYKPATVASLAYDGVALAVSIAADNGEFSVHDLTNPRGFIGVDGIFRLRHDGLTERGLAIMTISNGKFEVLDPAPRNFSEITQEEIESYSDEEVHDD